MLLSLLPGDSGGGQSAVCAASQVQEITRSHGDRGRGDIGSRGDCWHRRHYKNYYNTMRIIVFTHDFEDLGGGDGVKVRELIADLTPEHAARVQRDVT